MERQGILAVVSGFSGAGKGTLMKELLRRYDNYALSISATTRSPREGEVDGREYFFVSKERFQQMIEEGSLVEYAQYVNHYYGTPKEYVMRQMAQGKDVILEIEIQGALFDYVEKYNLITSKIHMPARVDSETEQRIQETAKRIYHALGCRCFARVDMFLEPGGRLVFNEVNTIPGFTSHSRFPNMMRGIGYDFPALLDELVAYGLEG